MPERTCVACRRKGASESLIRLNAVNGDLLVAGRTSLGRSAYVCPSDECIRKGVVGTRLSRAFRTSVTESQAEEMRKKLECRRERSQTA